MALSGKRLAFVEAYLGPARFNATEAARQAKYKGNDHTLAQVGYENLRKPEIAKAIRVRLSETTMSADEVLARLADQARSSMADFLRIDEEEITVSQVLTYVSEQEAGGAVSRAISRLKGEHVDEGDEPRRALLVTTETVKRPAARIDLMEAGKRGKLHLIKKFSQDKDGKIAIELYDAYAARELLAKHHGLLIERREITGKDGAPIEVSDARSQLLDRLARRAADVEAPGDTNPSGGSAG